MWLLPIVAVGTVACMCVIMFGSVRLWVLDQWRYANRVARRELERFARDRRGQFRPSNARTTGPAAGTAAVRIAGCLCRASFRFRWVEARSSRKVRKCLLVTKCIRADLRDLWTERLDPARFCQTLRASRQPGDGLSVQPTPRGLQFRAGPSVPLEELAKNVARYLDLYARAVDEANRPDPRVYR